MKSVVLLLAFLPVAFGYPSRAARINWIAMNGPAAAAQRLIEHQGRLLLIVRDSRSWRSIDRGVTWQHGSNRIHSYTEFAYTGRDLFLESDDGLARTSDVGDSWTDCGVRPLNRSTLSYTRSIAADAGSVYVWIFNVGLFHSTDRCATWTALTTPWRTDSFPNIFVVSGALVIITLPSGLFVSRDHGRSWSQETNTRPFYPFTVVQTCNHFLAGTSDGIFRSLDGAETWVPGGLQGQRVRSIATSDCQSIFAVVDNDGAMRTTTPMKSVDQGRTWTPASDGLSGNKIHDVEVGPNASVYAVGEVGAYRWVSDRWQNIGPAAAAVSRLATTPWQTIVAVSGGISQASVSGGEWRKLPVASGVTYTVAATDRSLLVGQENGVWRSSDRGETWQRMGLASGVTQLLPLPNGVVLAGRQDGLFRSTDDGQTWIERSVGLTSFLITAMAAGPTGTVYVGTQESGVSRSTDQGERWRPLPRPLDRGPVRALLVLADETLIAATPFGLMRVSTDGQSERVLTGLKQGAVRALVQGAEKVLFAAADQAGAFVSFDDGRNWVAANDGLNGERVFSLTADANGQVFAGTSEGVFRALIQQ